MQPKPSTVLCLCFLPTNKNKSVFSLVRYCVRLFHKGRAPALEILRMTPRIRELVLDPDRTREIVDAISSGYTQYGMQTFDQSLMSLYKNKIITLDEALRQATNADDFKLRASGVGTSGSGGWDDFEEKGDESDGGDDDFVIDRL